MRTRDQTLPHEPPPSNRTRSGRALGFSLILACGVLGSSAGASAASGERVLHTELTLPAPVAEVWAAWTTREGITSFFAPGGAVDLRVDGTYDIWFNPAGKPGERGAEGMRILDVDPLRRFAFTWNAPPSIPVIREKRTLVVLEFEARSDGSTRLAFTQLGWGTGPDWDKAYEYFDHAWGAIVLPRLLWRCAHGPLDWTAPPELEALPSLRRMLEEIRPAGTRSDERSPR